MVDEYLSEREQAEQLKVWFKENWIWLATGVALGLGGLYGFRWYEARLVERSIVAEQRYGALLEALNQNDRDAGRRLAAELTAEYDDTPYADQARLVLARVHVEAGELEDAAGRLAEVMNDAGDPELQLVARLRLARVELARGRHAEAQALLDGVGTAAVDARVHELRGDVLEAQGDAEAALQAWREAAAAAAASAAGPSLVDLQLIELKIAALAAQQEGE